MGSDYVAPVSVRIPDRFKTSSIDSEFAEGSGSTVREVLDSIKGRYPQLHRAVFTETGMLKDSCKVFVGQTGTADTSVHLLQGLDTPVSNGDIISIGRRRNKPRKSKAVSTGSKP